MYIYIIYMGVLYIYVCVCFQVGKPWVLRRFVQAGRLPRVRSGQRWCLGLGPGNHGFSGVQLQKKIELVCKFSGKCLIPEHQMLGFKEKLRIFPETSGKCLISLP